MTDLPQSTVHKISRGDDINLSARVFPGEEPAYLLLHGFPDNSHIFDRVIPYLTGGGRKAVAIDFLGFGASDKPSPEHYSFQQQLGDVEAVVNALQLQKVIPVGHDAGGPAAVNYAIKHPEHTAGVILLNSFYGEAPGLLVPEVIDLFSIKRLSLLHDFILKSPANLAWLFAFQRTTMTVGLSDSQKEVYENFLGPIVEQNFVQQPSSMPAFASMISQLTDELAANTARLAQLRRTAIPFQFIWGKLDTYLHISVAEYIRSQIQNTEIHALNAGHWPQIDAPEETAELMLKMA